MKPAPVTVGLSAFMLELAGWLEVALAFVALGEEPVDLFEGWFAYKESRLSKADPARLLSVVS